MTTLNPKLQKLVRQIEKFNAELEEYYKTSEDRCLPTVDCTIVGWEDLEPYAIKTFKNCIKVEAEGETYKVSVVGKELEGWDSLKESLRIDKRRLAKAWRIWKSENPDVELMKDEEED